MTGQTTLRRELITAFAVVFAGALMVAVAGSFLLLPQFDSPVRAFVYLILLLIADILVFSAFGRWLIRNRVLDPLDRIIQEAEAIAEGDYGRRLSASDSVEIGRLSDSLNRMAERLIRHQRQLADNIASLERTNRELTEARDELIRAEKMSSLGQMAAGVAHEIGNPLSAVVGNMDLLKRRLEGRELDLVNASAEQARRIDRIVRGLLDYSRTREAKVRPINVGEVVHRTLELIRTQGRFSNVEITTALDHGVPAVDADPYQLEQVLVNLLLNAADAMGGEGGIRISCRSMRYQEPSYLPSRRKDDLPGIDYSHRRRFLHPERVPRTNPFRSGDRVVEIGVADTGPGVPPDVLDRIFEPFMTTKEPGKGTGLGLAVSARLVDGMDGTIRADNTDEGAVFTILLPASEQTGEALGQ